MCKPENTYKYSLQSNKLRCQRACRVSSLAPNLRANIDGRLTQLGVLFYSGDLTSPLNWLPENGELRLLICPNEAPEDGLPQRV